MDSSVQLKFMDLLESMCESCITFLLEKRNTHENQKINKLYHVHCIT